MTNNATPKDADVQASAPEEKPQRELSGARVALFTIAGVGLVGLGLLGGVLIGHYAGAPGDEHRAPAANVYIQPDRGALAEHPRLREGIRDHVKERLQDWRTEHPPVGPSEPGPSSSTPSEPAPSDAPPVEGG